MASGNSADPGQIPVKCQFCEVSDIKLRCLQCDLYLCQECSSKIHSKIKEGQNHIKIDLTDLGSLESAEAQRKYDLENILCSIHQDQKCFSYCTYCVRAICIKCLRDKCQNHRHDDLYESYKSKYSKIKEIGDKIKNNIPFYDNEEKRLEKSLSESKQESDQLRKQIQDQETELKAVVAKFSQNLLQKVDDIYNPGQAKLQDELERIQKTRDILKKQEQTIDKVLLSYQASDVLNEGYSKEINMPEKVPCDIETPKAKFIQHDLTNVSLDEVFGSVHRIPELKLSESYQTNLDRVFSIVHSDHDMKFIGSYICEKLQKVKAKKDKLEVIKEEDIKVYDMDMMDNGDLVISTDGSELELYTKSGTVQTYKTFSPLQTLGVHVTKHNEVLVGLTDLSGPSWPVSKDSIRPVVVLNNSGNIQHTYEYDKNNQRLFTYPFRIVPCEDNICVIDLLNSSLEGRVVVIDYRGSIQWVYNGCGMDRPKFYPRDTAVTSTDMILVSDEISHAINVLSLTGEVIVCHNVKDLGIESPFSLAIDTSGLLWVGCDRKGNAKLHVVKLLN